MKKITAMRKAYLKEQLFRVIDERDKLREKILDISEDWRAEVATLRHEINRISRESKVEINNWRKIAQLIDSDNVDDRNLGYSLYDAKMKVDDIDMTNDIVKRLRHMAPFRCGETCPMCDGAEEIERLRAELENVRDMNEMLAMELQNYYNQDDETQEG